MSVGSFNSWSTSDGSGPPNAGPSTQSYYGNNYSPWQPAPYPFYATSLPKSPSPSPPLPETYQHWDAILLSFLQRIGLTQAAAGLEVDMLVLNPDWEQKQVPPALADLVSRLSLLGKPRPPDHTERSLDERKLDYVHLANDAPPRSQSMVNKSISAFLARNRARNDASNRSEFVYTRAQKRRRLEDNGDDLPSCARADAKPLDRDVQMKYDIAKNNEGPLSRTVVSSAQAGGKGKQKAEDEGPSPGADTENLPGLDERLQNIETHLAVRYVPAAPRTLLDRLKFLEDHLIRLEKEYPPWAALHFNQPNRGWPPPPRLTPIIVPPHMRPPPPAANDGRPTTDAPSKSKNSSLHRAVLERLEVHQAMHDLTGGSGR